MRAAIMRGAHVALLALSGCAPDAADDVHAPEAEARALDVPALAPDACGGVDPAVLLDVGHADVVKRVVRAGDRVLSVGGRRWVLWDVARHRQLASGLQATGSFTWQFPAQLAGDTILTSREPRGRAIDVRDARDGRVLGTLDVGSNYAKLGLAVDGSYVWRADGQTLRVLTREGRLLFERAGDYANAVLYAAPDALRVAARPDGTGEIELLSLPDGAVTRGPRTPSQGVQWFADGARFIAPVAGAYAVYDLAGKLLHTVPVAETVGGAGDRVWSYARSEAGDSLRVARIGDAQPLVTLSLPHVHRDVVAGSGAGTLALYEQPSFVAVDAQSTVQQLDLRAERPEPTTFALPGPVRGFDADAHGAWAAGTERGVVHLGEPGAREPASTLGCGNLLAFAVVPGGRVAIATDDGAVRIYDALSGPKLVSTIAAHTTAIALTADGTFLVTRGARTYVVGSDRNAHDQSVRVFSADDGKLVHQFAHAQGDQPAFMDFGLSADGKVAQRMCTLGASDAGNTRTCTLEVSDLNGVVAYRTEPVSWVYPGNPWDDDPPRFSPSGRRLAFTVPRVERGFGEADTVLYEDGRLLRVFAGRILAWLDDAHLLVRAEQTKVVDLEGAVVASNPDLTPRTTLGAAGAEHYYSGSSIYRVSDGSEAWTTARVGVTGDIQAVAGDLAVIRAGERVRVVRWR